MIRHGVLQSGNGIAAAAEREPGRCGRGRDGLQLSGRDVRRYAGVPHRLFGVGHERGGHLRAPEQVHDEVDQRGHWSFPSVVGAVVGGALPGWSGELNTTLWSSTDSGNGAGSPRFVRGCGAADGSRLGD